MMRKPVNGFLGLTNVLMIALALSGCAKNVAGNGETEQPVAPQSPEAPKDPIVVPAPGPSAGTDNGGSPEELPPQVPSQPPAGPVAGPVTGPVESSPSGIAKWVYSAVPWRARKGSDVWTESVVKVVRKRLADLERARDKEDFCPGYNEASIVERETCWLLLVAGIAKKESNFIATDSFHEGGGLYSYGLLSLSPGECANAPTVRDLHDPVRNLICGTNIMAKLIARHGFIDGPASSRGAAAYWSTLRMPYSNSAGYSLGKKKEIMVITRGFRKPVKP